MTAEDMHTAVEWAANEGWNPGINDADCFYNTDTNGFFAIKAKGEIIGCISAVKYNSDYGFIGFYIVKPDLRGKLIGLYLANKALEYLHGCSIGIDGVLNKVNNYRNFGFNIAHQNQRFKGISTGFNVSEGIFEIDKTDYENIFDYDTSVFGLPRKLFIEKWITQNSGITMVFRGGSKINGFITLRKCFEGYKIGPLFADDQQIAEKLFESVLSRITGSVFFIDIPLINAAAIKLVQKYNLIPVFVTARMYIGKAPLSLTQKIYGITSFELG